MSEEWRPIPGHPGYEASTEGRVRSWVAVPHGRRDEPKVLRLVRSPGRPYWQVALGRSKRGEVHTFVAAAFFGPRPAGLVTRHLDGDPNNNRPSNLAYGTVSENGHDRVRHGNDYLANRTHCNYGHEYTDANTYVSPKGGRVCRECRRAIDRRRWAARAARVTP